MKKTKKINNTKSGRGLRPDFVLFIKKLKVG